MDREELIALITKFHQNTITDLELARLKMFVGGAEAQEMLEDIDFPVSLQLAPVDVPPGMYTAVRDRISFIPAKQQTGKRRYLWLAAASTLLIVFLAAWWWNNPSVKPAVWAHVSTSPGERKKLVLTDGSTVYLNACSYLSYPEKYTDSIRLVQLKGEAFFEITPDVDRPFIVQTAHTTTRVLGTSFNIEAHEREGLTRVALVEGKVETGNRQNKMILSAGEMMLHENNTGHQSVHGIVGDVAAWIKGELVFNGVSLKEALQRINEAYNVQITIAGNISNNYTITGHFQKESPEKILNVLLAVYGLKWRESQGHYEIYQ